MQIGIFERQILANKIARLFYSKLGYDVDEGFEFNKSNHPQEVAMFYQGMLVVEMLSLKNASQVHKYLESKTEGKIEVQDEKMR